MGRGGGGTGPGGRGGGGFRPRAVAKALDEVDHCGGQAGEVGEGFVDHDGLARRRAGGGAPRGALGGDALALDEQDELIGFVVVLGPIAFDEHAGRSLRQSAAGGKHNSNILETTQKPHHTRVTIGYLSGKLA